MLGQVGEGRVSGTSDVINSRAGGHARASAHRAARHGLRAPPLAGEKRHLAEALAGADLAEA